MADVTIVQLSTVATSAVAAAGLSSAHLEVQIDGLSAPESRQLGLDQVVSLLATNGNVVRAASSSIAVSASSAAVTGTLSVNTGMSVVRFVVATIRGALGSSSASVSTSALASAGWFQLRVYNNPVSSSEAPVVSSVAVNVDWIAQGTL